MANAAVLLMLALTVLAGCRPDKAELGRRAPVGDSTATDGRSDDSPVVARIGDRPIRFEDVTSSLDALPVFVRMRYQAPERRLEFLEAYIEFQILALSASTEGFGGDPLVVDALKRDLVSRYLRENVDSRFRVAGIPESDVAAWYEANRHEFVHPAQNKVHRILVKDQVEAAKVAFRAGALVPEATGDPSEVFASLVRPPWVKAEGDLKVEDLGFLPDVSGRPSSIPQAVQAVAGSMGELFSVAGPVAAEDGWSILFLAAKRPAAEEGIDQARTGIASIILEQRRLAARRALADGLREGRVITVDDDVLAGIGVEAGSSGSVPGQESIR